MINDLSTLSRAERGKLEISVDPINVHDLCRELASDCTPPQAQAKGLAIHTTLDPKLELLPIQQALRTGDTAEFHHQRHQIYRKRRGSSRSAPNRSDKGVEFAVTDSGIGISKGDQERVFDKFFRAAKITAPGKPKNGLGLYVTMKLARLLHAEIALHSELNKGSTFTIFIPSLS